MYHSRYKQSTIDSKYCRIELDLYCCRKVNSTSLFVCIRHLSTVHVRYKNKLHQNKNSWQAVRLRAIHTMPDKFENATLLLQVRLPSTLIHLYPHKKIHENGTF